MPQRGTEAFAWLIEPRWGALGAYLVALALSHAGLIQSFPAGPILGAAVITLITNLVLRGISPERQTQGLTLGLLLFDASVLTGALYLTGGA